jgi:diguanylate cyclase (GGDEF)-like protein/hemerythrin-like metal-binding protein
MGIQSDDGLTCAALELLVSRGAIALGIARDGILVRSTPKLDAMFRWPSEPGTRKLPLGELVANVDRERVLGALAALGTRDAAIAAQDAGAVLIFDALRTDGTVFEAEVSAAVGELGGGPALVLLVTDVTERRRTEKQLSFMAFLDPLTGLANRALFLDRMRDTLSAARRDRRVFAVLMCDLDGFKQVNDTHGHEAGDELLKTVARRLERAVRDSDTVARLGGDEFAIILPKVASREHAAIVTERVVHAFDDLIRVGDAQCKVGISIGIATYPVDGADMDALTARADVAMYDSKRAGKNRYTFASPGDAETLGRLPLLLFHWTPAHEVGVKLIDAQHRRLVELLNELGELLKSGAERDAIVAALGALVMFTTGHFKTEERLMVDQPGWSLATQHAQEHQKLLDDVTSLVVQVDAQSMTRTVRFLQEWLLRHITTMDAPLAAWLRQRGVK